MALALLVYAAVLATVGGWSLRRAAWCDRAPRLAIVAWQALTLSIVTAVAAAGLVWRFPHPAVRACSASSTACGVAVGATGAALALVAWTLGWLVLIFARSARQRRRQLNALALLGRPTASADHVIIDHAVPVAYCLRGKIVLSSGALAALDDEQLAAVLAHERAHLCQRHDLVATAALAFARAFPGIPVFRHAHQEIGRLIELAADDAAGRSADRLTIADAILALATTPVPAATLAAAQTATAGRVTRLIAPSRPLGRTKSLLAAAAVTTLLALPIALVAESALSDPACAPTATTCHLNP